MPKRRRLLSAFLAVWLCVMLISYTYTWVSRNWTPSIKGDDFKIASAGALVISVLGDNSEAELWLNDILSLKESGAFTFRQVSSQDGINFFWKDFSPQLTDENNPANFIRAGAEGDNHDEDYLVQRFCLKYDESMTEAKYIFIHPDSYISYTGEDIVNAEGEKVYLNKAIRISLTMELPEGDKTIVLADLDDGVGFGGSILDDVYTGVVNLPGNQFSEVTPGATAFQIVHDLHYFDCGRTSFDYDNKFNDANYVGFTKDAERTLFTMDPGDTIWITLRIWLEGEDINCQSAIAGKDFDLLLKFDSVFVK